MGATDPLTVESLQSRIPTLSISDFEYIQKHMHSGHLFPDIKEPLQRRDVTSRLLSDFHFTGVESPDDTIEVQRNVSSYTATILETPRKEGIVIITVPGPGEP